MAVDPACIGAQVVPREHYKTWNGWAVGSYVRAWLPADNLDGHLLWQDHRVLVVDIWKDAGSHVRFVVAQVYSREVVARRLRSTKRLGWCKDLMTRCSWPKGYDYILSSDYVSVYEWELRTWARCATPSIATRHWRILFASNLAGGTALARALHTSPTFAYFLKLPRELRDQIYSYALLDEAQNTTKSRIHTYSLLRKRELQLAGQVWRRDFFAPILGPLPRIQTPGIFGVNRQIHREASARFYADKVFVLTNTCPGDYLDRLAQFQLPDLGRFLHVRVDVMLGAITPETLIDRLFRVANLLEQRASALQFLELRVASPHIFSAANSRNHSFVHKVASSDVLNSIRAIATLVRRMQPRKDYLNLRSLDVSMGISDSQRELGDYSCHYTYLTADSLQRLWRRELVATRGEEETEVAITEQTCADMGCKLHCG
jgi:hypothetical protein